MNRRRGPGPLGAGVCAVLGVLAGCSTSVAGHPLPAAGFTSPSRVEVPAPRVTVGIDPCTLLTPADLADVGGSTGPPRSGTPIAQACSFPVGPGPEDTAGAGFHVSWAEAIRRQPGGVRTEIDGYPSWLYCELVEAHRICTAVTAIREDQSLLTLLSRQGASAADTADALYRITGSALSKLEHE